MSLIISFNTGHVATFIIGCVYLFYGLYYEKIQNSLLKWTRNIFIIGNIIMISVITFIAVFGNKDTATYKEDAVIVLGTGLNGETITLPLQYRLEKTIEYYTKNPNVIIVLSGGQGPDETITEALAMERFLLSKGVPENKMIKEDRSTSTYENFIFSKKLLDNYFKNDYKTIFITNDFHIFRANEISKVAGMNSNHMHAKMEWYLVPITYTREFLAIIKFLILKE
ncbi:YdcF family protein [Paenibacillus cellulosilyticus]|nr:YdcF family protein [Paenibacillus cellulosilyticus]